MQTNHQIKRPLKACIKCGKTGVAVGRVCQECRGTLSAAYTCPKCGNDCSAECTSDNTVES